MAVKIQINSLEALERLIGGDTEMEVEIRNSVVQNFSNKYLKGIANEYIKSGTDKALKNYIDKDVFGKSNHYDVRLSEKHVSKIEEWVEAKIRSIVDNKIMDSVHEIATNERIKDVADARIERYVKNIVDEDYVKERAKKMIEEKFK